MVAVVNQILLFVPELLTDLEATFQPPGLLRGVAESWGQRRVPVEPRAWESEARLYQPEGRDFRRFGPGLPFHKASWDRRASSALARVPPSETPDPQAPPCQLYLGPRGYKGWEG